jgi:tripartite-type tricarboxylate transporter receptor subunit TctC
MTNRSRRSFFDLVRLGIFVPVLAQGARAEVYPLRPVRLLVGFPPGGPNDTLARLMGRWLSERLGQPFLIENRPGASGNIATEAVVRAPPDGYTLLLIGPANAITASTAANLNFDFLNDIAPIAGITREPLVLVVHPSVPARTVQELISYAKANPKALNMASTGQASSPHAAGELFKLMSGIDLPVVQYSGGGPALKGLIGGDAQLMFEPLSAAIEPIRAGKLRALAVSTASRSEALPDVPTVSDAIPGYEASAVTGLGAPKGTSTEVIETLNNTVNAAFADPQMRARIAQTGGAPVTGSPAEFRSILAEEIEKWAKVIRRSQPKPN